MKDLMMRALDLATRKGAQYADIRVVENQTETLATRNGIVQNLNFTDTLGFGVRVLAGGAWGVAS
nr:DNA gyrase modulator [Anaerolineales bacterium]